MKKNNFKTKAKVGDYVIFCDICRMPMWASQAVVLDKYTGRGGLVVCPNDRDSIDYGLVPYQIPAEESPKLTRDAHYASNPQDVPTSIPGIDLSVFDPLSVSPATLATVGKTWDQLSAVTWDQWDLPWGS